MNITNIKDLKVGDIILYNGQDCTIIENPDPVGNAATLANDGTKGCVSPELVKLGINKIVSTIKCDKCNTSSDSLTHREISDPMNGSVDLLLCGRCVDLPEKDLFDWVQAEYEKEEL